MIRKTERYYMKKVKTFKSSFKDFTRYGTQKIKKTTYWLFYVIPIFTKEEIISGDFEDKRR